MKFRYAPFGLIGQWICGDCRKISIQRYRPEKCIFCGAVPEEFRCPDCGSPAKLTCDTPIAKSWECSKIGCGAYDMDMSEVYGEEIIFCD